MLPKGKLGRSYFRKLFVYSDNQIPFTCPLMNSDSSKENEILSLSNYNKLNLATIGKNPSWLEIKN
jgi:ribosomal protein L13